MTKYIVCIILALVVLYIINIMQVNFKESEENKFVISKLANFKERTGRFPQNLEDMGLTSKLEGPIYYILREDGSCMLYRAGVLGESEVIFAGVP